MPSAVLHIGAHLGEEASDYRQYGFSPVWWVEANTDLVEELSHRLTFYPGNHVIQAVLAETEKPVTFHLASNGQSSSIFPLGTHAEEHPEVTYVDERPMQATTLDLLREAGQVGRASFMNLDVQGAELNVLQGGRKYLEGVRYIYTEINERPLYEGCALLPELEGWLEGEGFRLVDKRLTKHGWGDGLFARA